MSDGYVGLPADSSGKKLDTEQLTVGANTVQRERMQIAGAAATDIAGVDATNGLDVDVTRVSGTVTVDGSGVTQPVSHAALTELAAAIDTELQVDVVGALPAGTNNIGDVDVASIAAGDNNIGNVDIVTVPADPFGANADAAVAAGAAGSIQAKLRRLSADLDAVKTAVETLDNAISGAEMQVDVVASLPAGTNNIGDVDIASIAAGDNNIGNVDIASIAAGDNNIGNVDIVTVPADPFGANADAAATAGGTGSIQAKLRTLTADLDAVKTAVQIIDNVVSGSEAQVDVVAALPAGTNNIGDVDAEVLGHGTVGTGRQVVTTAGTRVQFSAQACREILLTAETDNTGIVVIGGSGVVAAIATRQGTPLNAGETAVLSVTNINLLYIDSTIDGDGVTYTYLT